MKNNSERERDRDRDRKSLLKRTQKGLVHVYNTTASIIHTCIHEQYKLSTNSIIEYNTHYTIPNTNTNTCGLKGTDNRTSGLCDVLCLCDPYTYSHIHIARPHSPYLQVGLGDWAYIAHSSSP